MTERSSIPVMIAGAVGGSLAIGGMIGLSVLSDIPLANIPFATSIVLVMGSPDTQPAQPRALVGGHLLSSAIGLVLVHALGPGYATAILAVGIAILVMHLTRTFHPPAGIDPLVVAIYDMPWSFLLIPVGAGVLLLGAFAFCWHHLVRRSVAGGQAWPERWR